MGRKREELANINIYDIPFKVSREVNERFEEYKKEDVQTYFQFLYTIRSFELSANKYCGIISAMLFKEKFGIKNSLTTEDRAWLDRVKDECKTLTMNRNKEFLEDFMMSLPRCIQQCFNGRSGERIFV